MSDGRETEIVARGLREPMASVDTASVDARALIAAAARHRVLLLLGDALRGAGTLDEWPVEFVAEFRHAERAAAALECVRHAELVSVLEALASAGVRVLLFKGAALAQTHYRAPYARPRADTDLLIARAELATLESVLANLGYTRAVETSGALVSYQSHYDRVDRYGIAHAFDVHWKISNVQALADRLTFDELWGARKALASLGAMAATVDDVHALLLALIHRAGHHPGSDNLLWMYDLHLLVSRLGEDERRRARDIVVARGLSRLAADGLGLARHRLGTKVGPALEALCAGATSDPEAVAPAARSRARLLQQDLAALPTWRERLRLIREHLLPDAGYVRARYGVKSNALLPAVYLYRVVAGAPKWLRRHDG